MAMHGKECYTCGDYGHFSSNCPKNSFGYSNKRRKLSNSSSSIAEITTNPKFPFTQCRCGGGFCKIKLISKSQKYFYCCPNINEIHCGYFKWCDELNPHEVLHQRPPPYPCCSCGAGVCRLETERTEGPNLGRKYFACRIKKTQGACNFRQWQDDYYQSTFAKAMATIAYDDSIANEIDAICREIENGEIALDYPLDEFEINTSDDLLLRNNKTHSSPSPSPTSPLDVEALASADSHGVVKWFPSN